MTHKEIKAVFDRVFNGMVNPMFCHPEAYFEHNGYLCEVSRSLTTIEAAGITEKNIRKNPLAPFTMMFVSDGGWLTVLTKDGERTHFGGYFKTDEELDELKSAIGMINKD